jgi:hypothetical protein
MARRHTKAFYLGRRFGHIHRDHHRIGRRRTGQRVVWFWGVCRSIFVVSGSISVFTALACTLIEADVVRIGFMTWIQFFSPSIARSGLTILVIVLTRSFS